MVLIIVVRDLFVTGLRSYAVIKGRPLVTSLFAKVKTFSQFGVLYFIFIFHLCTTGRDESELWEVFRRIQEIDLILVLMYGITLLTVVSGSIYMIENRSHLRWMARDIYRIFVSSDT